MNIYLTLLNFRQSYSNRLRRGVKSEPVRYWVFPCRNSNRLRRGVKSEPVRLVAFLFLDSNRLRRGVKSEPFFRS